MTTETLTRPRTARKTPATAASMRGPVYEALLRAFDRDFTSQRKTLDIRAIAGELEMTPGNLYTSIRTERLTVPIAKGLIDLEKRLHGRNEVFTSERVLELLIR